MRIEWRPRRFEVFAISAMAVGLYVVFSAQMRNIKRGETCQNNLKKIALGTTHYARDYDELLPLAHNWFEVLDPYTKNASIFHCPSVTKFGYSMNAHLNGLSWDKTGNSRATPMYFESSMLKQSQSDTGASWLQESRHSQGKGIVFQDGHVEWRKSSPPFHAFEALKEELPLNKD